MGCGSSRSAGDVKDDLPASQQRRVNGRGQGGERGQRMVALVEEVRRWPVEVLVQVSWALLVEDEGDRDPGGPMDMLLMVDRLMTPLVAVDTDQLPTMISFVDSASATVQERLGDALEGVRSAFTALIDTLHAADEDGEGSASASGWGGAWTEDAIGPEDVHDVMRLLFSSREWRSVGETDAHAVLSECTASARKYSPAELVLAIASFIYAEDTLTRRRGSLSKIHAARGRESPQHAPPAATPVMFSSSPDNFGSALASGSKTKKKKKKPTKSPSSHSAGLPATSSATPAPARPIRRRKRAGSRSQSTTIVGRVNDPTKDQHGRRRSSTVFIAGNAAIEV